MEGGMVGKVNGVSESEVSELCPKFRIVSQMSKEEWESGGISGVE